MTARGATFTFLLMGLISIGLGGWLRDAGGAWAIMFGPLVISMFYATQYFVQWIGLDEILRHWSIAKAFAKCQWYLLWQGMRRGQHICLAWNDKGKMTLMLVISGSSSTKDIKIHRIFYNADRIRH